jgi:glycosyltransferase involved in cell wall biosynthesis
MNSSENKHPAVSVILPVYNGEKFLRPAIESILNQTFGDFELILINDGSSDGTEKIIQEFSDSRIVYLNNGENLGLSRSYNRAINIARGAYIARMDADDISEPKRFERQVSFLKRHPHVDIVGSSVTFIDEKGNKRGMRLRQEDHTLIKFSSLFSTPLMHPAIIGKASLFKSHHYNENLHNSEDYELWSRLLFETDTHFANIREPLLQYRTFPNSFTQTLNLDKRTVSAHNTIKNIGHYIVLTEREKRLIVYLRQEKRLSALDLISIFFIYVKAAWAFVRKERLAWKKALRVYFFLLPQVYFLAKYCLKQILKKP